MFVCAGVTYRSTNNFSTELNKLSLVFLLPETCSTKAVIFLCKPKYCQHHACTIVGFARRWKIKKFFICNILTCRRIRLPILEIAELNVHSLFLANSGKNYVSSEMFEIFEVSPLKSWQTVKTTGVRIKSKLSGSKQTGSHLVNMAG